MWSCYNFITWEHLYDDFVCHIYRDCDECDLDFYGYSSNDGVF